MEVICLETDAFYQLVEDVIEHLNKDKEPFKYKWIDTDEAMKLLNIKSKTTLQKLRDEGVIRYTQPQKRIILYDRDSILDYLEGHAKDTF